MLRTFVHEDEIHEYDLFGIKIKCTQNHKFYTTKGWKKIKDIQHSDIILINENPTTTKPSFFTESHIDGTYAPRMKIVENIIERLSQIKLEDMDFCTEIFPNPIMEKYLPQCIFITATSLPSTMKLVTWGSFLPKSVVERLYTGNEKLKKLIGHKYPPLPKKGIRSMGKKQWQKKINAVSSGNNVPSPLPRERLGNRDFVAINVKSTEAQIIMSLEYVNGVMKNLPLINPPLTALPHVLLNSGVKQNVYNLHVEDYHGFFANNILALNCLDSIRYALFSHFFRKDHHENFTAADADALERKYLR